MSDPFSDEDLAGYVCADHFERARLLLNSVAHVLGCTEKPNLGNNFFEIGGDSINMVQVIIKTLSQRLAKDIIIV